MRVLPARAVVAKVDGYARLTRESLQQEWLESAYRVLAQSALSLKYGFKPGKARGNNPSLAAFVIILLTGFYWNEPSGDQEQHARKDCVWNHH